MQQKSINTPYGGMDFDTANEYIAKDKVRYALNTRVVADDGTPLGRRTNLKGNTLVPNDLPVGQNECIGSYYDEGNSKMYYFVWNSNSNHSVYQFDDITKTIKLVYQDASLMLDLEHRINQINVIGGNILCWTDNQSEPKKILIDRGLNTYNGLREFNTYFNKNSLVGGVFRLTVTFKDGTPDFVSGGISVPPFDTISELIEYLNVGFAGSATNPAFPVVITGCDCTLTSVAKTINVATVSFSLLGGYDVVTVANNFYPDTSISQFVDAIPYAPLDKPDWKAIQDAAPYNKLRKQVYQFAYRYQFVQGQFTALSPYSIAAFNNVSCGDYADAYNAIEVNYLNDDLLNPDTFSLINRVQVYVRYSEIGKWYEIANIKPCEIIENDYKFRFLNDGNYSILDDNSASKPYDDLPIVAKAQTFIKDRIFYANNDEDREIPSCINADVNIIEREIPQNKTYTATVRLKIWNPQWNVDTPLNANTLLLTGGDPYGYTIDTANAVGTIVKHKTDQNLDYPVWGGIGVRADSQYVNKDVGNFWGQWLPESGWPVYCAGTDNYAISRQVIQGGSLGLNSQQVITDPNGAFEFQQLAINHYNGADVYSEAKITGLTNGEYIIRVASGWCSLEDKMGKGRQFDLLNGRAFHQTSTPIIGIRRWNKDTNSYYPFESFIFEVRVVVNDADVFVGDFYLWDMSDTRQVSKRDDLGDQQEAYTHPAIGYLYDTLSPELTGGASDRDSLKKYGVRIERHYIYYLYAYNDLFLTGQFRGAYVTDHNGFFAINAYSLARTGAGDPNLSNQIYIAVAGCGSVFPSSPYLIYNGFFNHNFLYYKDADGVSALEALVSGTYLNADEVINQEFPSDIKYTVLHECIVPNYDAGYSFKYRTFIEGTAVTTTGVPVAGISVAVTNTSRTDRTGLDGAFQILVYADMWNPVPYRLVAGVHYYNSVACIGFMHEPLDVITIIAFSATSYPDYKDITRPFIIGDTVRFDEIVEFNTYQPLKQNGAYKLGLILTDYAGRKTLVYSEEKLNIKIPSIPQNKRFSVYDVYWTLGGIFENWVSKIQWVISKELTTSFYLQWAINYAEYVKDFKATSTFNPDGTTFYDLFPCPKQEADFVWMDLSNLIDFKKRFPNSHVGYNFEQGDRVILWYKENNTFFSKFYDLPIVSYINGGLLVDVRNVSDTIATGDLIQIYRPKGLTEESTLPFYEFGESIDVVNGVPQKTAGRFNHVDTVVRSRLIDVPYASSTKYYTIEDTSICDDFASVLNNYGRINVQPLINAHKRYVDRVRWGNFNPDGSILNNNFSFDLLDYIETSLSYGAITGMASIGNILIIQQERQTISFYVDESILRNIRGTDIVGVSSQVLQSYNVLVGGFGCVNQEGIVTNRNNFVFPDSTRGNMVKYGGNGTINISGVDEQNKSNKLMNAYFKKRLNDILAGGQVVGTYDRFLNEWVFITRLFTKNNVLAHGVIGSQTIFTLGGTDNFVAGEKVYVDTVDGRNILIVDSWDSTARELRATTTQLFPTTNIAIVKISTESVGYSEIIDQWSSFYAYYEAEQGQYVNNGYAIFSNGQLWLSHTNPTRNNFFGKQYTSQVRVIPNDMPNENKIWQSLMINQDSASFKWAAPVVKNDSGQLSRILNNIFKKLEYFWYAEFKKDLNTVSVSNPILNGKEIRSNTVDILLENDSTEDAQLTQVSVGWIPSQRTNK